MERVPIENPQQKSKIDRPKVVVSELAGANTISPETLQSADLEVRFFNTNNIRRARQEGRNLLVHILPYREKNGNLIYLNLADPDFEQKLDQLDIVDKINEINPSWVSLHLGWSVENVGPGDVGRYEQSVGGQSLDRKQLMQRFCRNITALKQRLPGREILVENLDWTPERFSHGAHIYLGDPDFIKEVLERANAGLLLDLQHAYLTARNRGQKLFEYLDQLPL